MLLKGYGHKQITALTNRSERTVRQHAGVVYDKAGLGGRAELSAFFLQDLMLPSSARAALPLDALLNRADLAQPASATRPRQG